MAEEGPGVEMLLPKTPGCPQKMEGRIYSESSLTRVMKMHKNGDTRVRATTGRALAFHKAEESLIWASHNDLQSNARSNFQVQNEEKPLSTAGCPPKFNTKSKWGMQCLQRGRET